MNVALDYPALDGRVVTQRHADHCATHGHATWTVDGADQGLCPRCGDGHGTATPEQAAQLTTEDGTVLTSATDLGLAWAWAEHAHGPVEWVTLSYGQQCQEAAATLDALRSANRS